MRRSLFLAVLCVVPSVGCEAIFHFDDYTTADPPDAATPDAASPTPVVDAAPASPVDAGADAPGAVQPECRTNADCLKTTKATTPSGLDASQSSDGDGDGDGETDGSMPDGGSPSICVKTTGTCAQLLTRECPRAHGDYTSDDAVILGAMLTGSGATADFSLEHAAWLAADEINSSPAGGLPALTAGGAARPLVVVGCDPAAGAVAAAKHLVNDLHVPAIVGPRIAEDVVDVTQQVSAKGNTLVLTPASLTSSLSNLVDNGLTWRDVPSDSQRAKLVIEQMNEIENVLHATRGPTVTLGILTSSDAAGTSARDAISGKLIINGHFISDPENAGNVSLDSYADASDTTTLAAIATKYARATPDIVYVTAAEQVATVLVPLEQALTLARATVKPYYVCTDAVKSDDFLAKLASTNVGADIRRRIRGIGVKPDTASAATFDAFDSAYEAEFGPNPSPAVTAATYDAMYSVAYAITATPTLPLAGASVGLGLRSLGIGDTFPVGAGQAHIVMQTLAAGKSVSLRGTFSLMQWDTSGDITGGTVEVWCVGTAGGPLAFGSSGLTMDVQTQVVGGAFLQCQ